MPNRTGNIFSVCLDVSENVKFINVVVTRRRKLLDKNSRWQENFTTNVNSCLQSYSILAFEWFNPNGTGKMIFSTMCSVTLLWHVNRRYMPKARTFFSYTKLMFIWVSGYWRTSNCRELNHSEWERLTKSTLPPVIAWIETHATLSCIVTFDVLY